MPDSVPSNPTSQPSGRPHRRSIRDRRGRGRRGPAIVPLTPGVPETPTAREVFDALVLESVENLEERWRSRLGLVEYAVEDTPVIPRDWDEARIPLSSLVRGSGVTPHRVVLFRRPIEHRAGDRAELGALVHTVMVEQIAELLGVSAEEVDPRYESD